MAKKVVNSANFNYLNIYSGLIDRGTLYNFKDKRKALKLENAHMLNMLLKMFEYENLPKTIPQDVLELITMSNGYSYITNKHNGELYVYRCALGGYYDEYYIPNDVIINNPYQKFNATLDREKDGVLFKNDPLFIGVIPMLNKYNTQIVETNITVDLLIKLTRAVGIISAQDDGTRVSAEKFINDIVNGEYSVVAESAFLDGIKSQPLSNSHSNNYITQLIELMNYLESKRLNAFGLQSNHNMKRESINEAEAGLNEKALLPYVDILLKQRQENIKKLNEKYELNVKVKLSSSWLLQHEESEEHIIEDMEDIKGTNDDIDNVGNIKNGGE